MTDKTAPMWVPDKARIANANLTAFMAWLAEHRGLKFDGYGSLWTWSVTEIESFWAAIWDFFKVQSVAAPKQVLAERRMPGADWFPGSRLNYAQHVLHRAAASGAAMIFADEGLKLRSVTRAALVDDVLRAATAMRAAGIRPGDRVIACLTNRPEAMIAMLATASIGAVWSIVSPEFGVEAMRDRFIQLQPRLLFAVDSYRFNSKTVDRRAELTGLVESLPSLERVVWLPGPDTIPGKPALSNLTSWAEFLGGSGPPPPIDEFVFEHVAFSHPLWILFSSGTTGLPKAITHSHGGMLLEQLKYLSFHMDLHTGERLFFYTITGWMMWNFLLGSLLVGAVPVLFEGHPTLPDVGKLWRLTAASGAAVFGASPSYVKLLQEAHYRPRDESQFPVLRAVLLSGSPASDECMQWFLEAVKPDLWVQSGSGGTDVCSGFVGGVPILPVYAGEIQARCLGVAAYAIDEKGRQQINQVGELIIAEPMPCMPIGFWGDDQDRAYFAAYFEAFPGVWRHGDFFRVNEPGGCFVLGRSDATLNRHGVRIGTAEIYRAMEQIDAVADSLVVNIELADGGFWMPLFVKTADGVQLDQSVVTRIRAHLRAALSPRHVPDEIIAVPDIPYTVTGKRLEVPVRRILMGTPIEQAVGKGTTHQGEALLFFERYAREVLQHQIRI